jgi:catechol 2,3-dioxygenase-like lactoylglutathione lyase family enzyme/ketosteroid isomerase-like protein
MSYRKGGRLKAAVAAPPNGARLPSPAGDVGSRISSPERANYAGRDARGKVAFYVLLWKRNSIPLELFDDYWSNVHGPVCARLPGQYQYWQFHLAHNEGGVWPAAEGIDLTCPADDQFDGIAELTFETEADRETWFKAAAILMDDEHNLFRKAIGYNTSPGNSRTYRDGIPTGDPNGALGVLKYHVMVKKADGVGVDAFRAYLTERFAPAVARSGAVLKFRLHLFDAVDNSRPDAAGVVHIEPPEGQYQAAFEIAFASALDMETFFASAEYAAAAEELASYVKQLVPFPERTAYTFVHDGKITLAGERSSKVAGLITDIGATNQLREDVVALMNGQVPAPPKRSLGQYLQGVQHFGFTVDDMAKAIEFYTEVLGGKVALSGDSYRGEVLHNTLFQREELAARELGVDPQTLGVPDVRDGSREVLDVRFVSFGNTCVELIHFRDGKLTPAAPNVFRKVPSSVGFANVSHLSFYVKDDVDLNEFARLLEEECHRRGLTNVVCNRVIHVNSEEERRLVALKYNANKFWNDPDYFIEGYSDAEFGDFHGWSLFYCKGPNGEQLEFNQVTRKAKENFTRAEAEYNRANGTNYWFLNSQKEETAMLTATATARPTRTETVKAMFKAGESMNVENFIKFYTEDAHYQFSNFPVVFGPDGIKDSSVGFLEKVAKCRHHIKNMWESGDTVICEMDVTYIRHDGKIFTLPVCDTIVFKGDKVQELRIYMDITPVFLD